MAEEEKVVYSVRYPFPQARGEDAPPVSEEDVKLTKMLLEEFLAFAEEESEFVPREDRLEKKEGFLMLAKQLSKDWLLDLDIVEGRGFVRLEFHLYFQMFVSNCAAFMGELLRMTDCGSLWPSDHADCKLTLQFDTHDRYLKGTLLNPQ